MTCAESAAFVSPRLRRRVLELVWSSHRAVKAYDLLAALGDAVGCGKAAHGVPRPRVPDGSGSGPSNRQPQRLRRLPAARPPPQRAIPHMRRLWRRIGAECGEYRPCRRRPGGRLRLCALTLDYRASRQMSRAARRSPPTPWTRPPQDVVEGAPARPRLTTWVVRYGGRTVLDRVSIEVRPPARW